MIQFLTSQFKTWDRAESYTIASLIHCHSLYFFSLPTCDQEPIPQRPSHLYHSAPGHIISHHYDFVVTDIIIYFHVGQLGIGWCGIHEAGFKLLIPPGWTRSTEHLRSGQQLGWGGSGVGGGEKNLFSCGKSVGEGASLSKYMEA